MAPGTKQSKPGCLGRLIKLTVFFVGMATILFAVDYVATTRAIRATWQYTHTDWSESTVDFILNGPTTTEGSQSSDQAGNRNHPNRAGATTLANSIVGWLTSGVQLDVVEGGYSLGNQTGGGRLATKLYRTLASGQDQRRDCTTGTYTAAFPLVRAACGDGSGRTLWFLMRRWPGENLELFMLPVGDVDLNKKIKEMSNGQKSPEQKKAAMEMLTFRFRRVSQ